MFDITDLLIFVPTLGRPKLLAQMVDSFLYTSDQAQMIIIHDNEDIQPFYNPRITSMKTLERVGYWGALNSAIDYFPYPLIGYFANDVLFHDGWEQSVVDEFNIKFPSGKGLLAVQDGVWDAFHASHGITTLVWLEVLYGKPKFPPYAHFYGDSELTQFSRDLGKFSYCKGAFIEHLHPNVDKRERDEVDRAAGDIMSTKESKQMYDERYLEWDQSGREEARKRMR